MMEMTNDDFLALNALYSQMTGSTDLVLYAVGGQEGDRFTYCGKILFSQLVEHYSVVPNAETLPPYLKLQRELVKSRSTGIRQYLLTNDDHIFPEVISISSEIVAERIEPAAANLFKITVPKESFRYLVDGQGRLVGIKEALLKREDLGSQSVDIKLVLSESIGRDGQVFSDVNSTPIAPNKSQCAAFDGRLVINQFAKRVIANTEGLNQIIDFNSASVTSSSKSPALWTLNQFIAFLLLVMGTTAKACQSALADEDKQAYWEGFITKFLSQLIANPQFAEAYLQRIPAQQSRKESIVGTSVFLKSIGLMGKVMALNFIEAGQADWSRMSEWKRIDLSVGNDEWIGRCKNFRGGFEDRGYNHRAMSSLFLSQMAFNVPEELEIVEEEVLINRAGIKKAQREAKKQIEAEQANQLSGEAA
jgi:DGQHR domain-containing protein